MSEILRNSVDPIFRGWFDLDVLEFEGLQLQMQISLRKNYLKRQFNPQWHLLNFSIEQSYYNLFYAHNHEEIHDALQEIQFRWQRANENGCGLRRRQRKVYLRYRQAFLNLVQGINI